MRFGQRVGFASLGAVVLRHGRAQLLQSSGPEVGVVLLGQRQRVQRATLLRVDRTHRERVVGVIAAHLGLPVVGERVDEMFGVPGVHA